MAGPDEPKKVKKSEKNSSEEKVKKPKDPDKKEKKKEKDSKEEKEKKVRRPLAKSSGLPRTLKRQCILYQAQFQREGSLSVTGICAGSPQCIVMPMYMPANLKRRGSD